jgi:FecR protein
MCKSPARTLASICRGARELAENACKCPAGKFIGSRLQFHSSGIQPTPIQIAFPSVASPFVSAGLEISLVMRRWLSFALVLLAGVAPAEVARAESDAVQVAQAQPTPIQTPAGAQPLPTAPAAPTQATDTQTTDAQAVEEPIGNVAALTGKASVKRNDKSIPLAVKDDIYLNDVVQTSANSSLGVTFSDGTTFNLKANAQITIDNFVYEEGGKKNAGIFDVAKGTVAFVASQVAKTGDMQITTPTATLGIRGTSGLVEVPAGATATSANNVNIKLYPDADGRVGRIEVNDRAGARLGFLSEGASGFAIRPGTGGARFAAVPITITPQMMQRDQGFVRQVQTTQTLGRRVFDEQRAFRRANPNFVNPNRPIRQPGQPGGPGQLRPNGQPGQLRPGQPQQPGQQNRPGQPQQQQPGAVPGRQGQQPGSPQQGSRQGQTGQGQPGQAGQPNRLPGQQGGAPLPGQAPRAGQTPAGAPGQAGTPPQGTPAGQPRPGGPTGTPPVNQPQLQQPGGAQPLPRQGGQLGQPGTPGLRQQPGLPGRPGLQAPRRTAPALVPKGKKRPNYVR